MEIVAMTDQKEKRTRLACSRRRLAEENFAPVATQKEVRDGEGAITPAGAGRGACAIPK
jgi:hypothetical protein